MSWHLPQGPPAVYGPLRSTTKKGRFRAPSKCEAHLSTRCEFSPPPLPTLRDLNEGPLRGPKQFTTPIRSNIDLRLIELLFIENQLSMICKSLTSTIKISADNIDFLTIYHSLSHPDLANDSPAVSIPAGSQRRPAARA